MRLYKDFDDEPNVIKIRKKIFKKLKSFEYKMIEARRESKYRKIENFKSVLQDKYPKMSREDLNLCSYLSTRRRRVGNTVGYDSYAVDKAVYAYVRHKYTDYDRNFSKGLGKIENRNAVAEKIEKVVCGWK